MTSIERELGNLEARMQTVETELQAIRGDVRDIRDALVTAKGGWRTMLFLISAATAIGATISHYLPLIAGFKG